MSLLPPGPAILSKMKFFLKNHLPPELYQEVRNHLPPFPIFKIKVKFRSTNPPSPEYVEIKDYPQNTPYPDLKMGETWDCVDTALNMFTRTKFIFKAGFTGIGHVQFILEAKPVDGPDSAWSPGFMDEIPFLPKPTTQTDGEKPQPSQDPEEDTLPDASRSQPAPTCDPKKQDRTSN